MPLSKAKLKIRSLKSEDSYSQCGAPQPHRLQCPDICGGGASMLGPAARLRSHSGTIAFPPRMPRLLLVAQWLTGGIARRCWRRSSRRLGHGTIAIARRCLSERP